jgi:hypothetical protein
MKAIVLTAFWAVCLLNSIGAKAQTTENKIPKIAIFTPLYLDSVFGTKGYKFGDQLQALSVPGVEFLYGAEAAIDSIRAEQIPLNYKIFDSKAKYKTVDNLIAEYELSDVDLIIAATSGPEVKKLADYAQKRNILFLNATYPNDAGVVANPNYIILNS